jgi:hypothetical protein
MDRSDIKRAIVAATSIARDLGLLADDAIVIHNSNKGALRLTPCDVFARVDKCREARCIPRATRWTPSWPGSPRGPLSPRHRVRGQRGVARQQGPSTRHRLAHRAMPTTGMGMDARRLSCIPTRHAR